MLVLEKSWSAFHVQNQPKEDKINYGDTNTLDKIAPSFSKKKEKQFFFQTNLYLSHITPESKKLINLQDKFYCCRYNLKQKWI